MKGGSSIEYLNTAPAESELQQKSLLSTPCTDGKIQILDAKLERN